MNIAANGKALVSLTKELSLRWDETKVSWQDAKSQEFEHKYLVDLMASVERAVAIFDDLAKVIAKVRNECE
jgi:hypothetical protein